VCTRGRVCTCTSVPGRTDTRAFAVRHAGADFTYLSFPASKFRARGPDATTTIMAALTEIRHCFPCRGGTRDTTMGRLRLTTMTSMGRARGHGMSQNSGRVTREREKNKGEKKKTAIPKNALLSLFSSFSPFISIYLRSPSLCLRQRAPARDCRYYGRVRIVTLIN